jgi:putative hydrolase of the HAD superfamily
MLLSMEDKLLRRIRAVIFDLGGTLIKYKGLPLYWGDYYKNAFQAVREKSNIDISDQQIYESIEILKKYNPRLYPRETEYSSDYIFSDITKNWDIKKVI